MNRIVRWGLVAVLCAFGVALAPAKAQPVAEEPDLKVGDFWVFHETGTDEGRSVDRRWKRYIAEMLPDKKMRVEPRYGEFEIVDMSSSQVSGRASASGTLMLAGTTIAIAEKFRGQQYPAGFEGRLGDGGFELIGRYGARKCALTITRAGG